MNSMDKTVVTFVVCIAIVVTTLIGSILCYNLNERNNMSKNMEQAISKGVDPLSVKCAYETNPTQICTILALGKK